MQDDRMFGGATVSDSPFGKASPILVLGIMILIIPMLGKIFNWNLPLTGLISILGGIVIAIGVIHSLVT